VWLIVLACIVPLLTGARPAPAQPSNDVCGTGGPASIVPGGGGMFNGSFSGATLDANSGACTGSSEVADVYCSFTPATAGYFRFSTCQAAGSLDTILSIHTGCPATVNNFATGSASSSCNDDFCGLRSQFDAGPLAAGVPITIRVARRGGGGNSAFTLSVSPSPTGACCDASTGACTLVATGTCAVVGGYRGDGTTCSPSLCPPPNDNCPSAAPLTIGVAAQATTVNATISPGFNQPDVWFRFTQTDHIWYTVRIEAPTSFRPFLVVYQDCPETGGVQLAGDVDNDGDGVLEVSFLPPAGGVHNYLARVGSQLNTAGTFAISYAPYAPLPWNECATAFDIGWNGLPPVSYGVQGNNYNCTRSAEPDPACGSPVTINSDVWTKWTAPATGRLNINVNYPTTNPNSSSAAIYDIGTGALCPSGSSALLACNTNGSLASSPVVQGHEHLFRIGSVQPGTENQNAVIFSYGLTPDYPKCDEWWVPGAAPAGISPNRVKAVIAWDPDGPGPQAPLVVVGGTFGTADGSPWNVVVAWDSATGRWGPLGGDTIPGYINTFAVLSDGRLAAGGLFNSSGLPGVVVWDGSAWSPLSPSTPRPVDALAVLPNGNLAAGGTFAGVFGGVAMNHVAIWNGTSWSSPGGGTDGSVVTALEATPSGDVIAAGDFMNAGGVSALHIARWNGNTWSAMGAGLAGNVWDLAVRPNGDLFAATIGVFRWTGSAWSPVYGGPSSAIVRALTALPNGDLVAGGDFTSAGSLSANRIGRWNGSQWFPLGSGLDGSPSSLAVAPDGSLWAAGSQFTTAGSGPSPYVGRFQRTQRDPFDGAALSPSWSGQIRSNAVLAPSSVGGGSLTVHSIIPGEVNSCFPSGWAKVSYERAISGLGDFEVGARIRWATVNPGMLSDRQYLYLELLDASNNVLAYVGYQDTSSADSGREISSITSFTAEDQFHPQPLAGSALIGIRRIGIRTETLWNGLVQISKDDASLPVAKARLTFAYYPYSCLGSTASYSGISVDEFFQVTPAPDPVITSHPASAAAGCQGQLQFSAAASGSLVAYQWQLETGAGTGLYADLPDGPLAGGGASVAGARTSLLSFSSLSRAIDRRRVRIRAASPCDIAFSNPATITVACPADFNCSGTSTVQDIFDFLAAYFAGDPRADFNGSNAITVQDIFDFLAAYFAGCA
jgi:hypothetical protein